MAASSSARFAASPGPMQGGATGPRASLRERPWSAPSAGSQMAASWFPVCPRAWPEARKRPVSTYARMPDSAARVSRVPSRSWPSSPRWAGSLGGRVARAEPSTRRRGGAAEARAPLASTRLVDVDASVGRASASRRSRNSATGDTCGRASGNTHGVPSGMRPAMMSRPRQVDAARIVKRRWDRCSGDSGEEERFTAVHPGPR